ncbi:DsrE/DsrF-like family protein [Methyloligella halotolerans]|uniref:DsrE/DsrF-like family protein n=1 Tax=Methyloligella halotolerans TaxID=1177755 RepID=A0A1E2RV62_9HYPH|nr:DsrE family protein [Methyloligella halotolerans]ODA65939.1 DsrE/DsrF-like family protein [Methyloligella halotolerans]
MFQRMNACLIAAAMLVCLASGVAAQGAETGDDALMPAVPFGKFTPVPNGHYRPDPSEVYKAVIRLTTKSEADDKPNQSLAKVGRLVNLFVSEGVPLDHLKFVVDVHGPATPIVLNDEQYAKRFGTKNPNLPLIKALGEAGVPVHVCGQALAGHEFEQDWVDPNVSVDLSAYMTVILSQGYAHLSL